MLGPSNLVSDVLISCIFQTHEISWEIASNQRFGRGNFDFNLAVENYRFFVEFN